MTLTSKQLELLIEIVEEKSDSLHKEVMSTEDPSIRVQFSEVLKLRLALIKATQYTVSINISSQNESEAD